MSDCQKVKEIGIKEGAESIDRVFSYADYKLSGRIRPADHESSPLPAPQSHTLSLITTVIRRGSLDEITGDHLGLLYPGLLLAGGD